MNTEERLDNLEREIDCLKKRSEYIFRKMIELTGEERIREIMDRVTTEELQRTASELANLLEGLSKRKNNPPEVGVADKASGKPQNGLEKQDHKDD